MYLLSPLHGHGTSLRPSVERHADRVHAGHEVAVAPSVSSTRVPTRVMMCMLATT